MAWNLPEHITLQHIDDEMDGPSRCWTCGRPFSVCRCWATEPEDAPDYEDRLNHD